MRIIKKEFIEDIQSTGYIYEHNCGAKIVYLENKDENRVFSVAFRTLPTSDKGLAHITEHSVLCGSENYRIKDPFNELDKGSIHTYLNAITYEDKTVYPIASTNEFDYENMMRVYLDGVFKPLIFEKEGIFRQEGWHYGENGYNGVVYNEMKGVFSSPDRILKLAVQKELYKGTGYQYYSGGVPEDIIKLEYNEFLDFYREYYHPSNSVFYLYGDIEIDKYIGIINSYIDDYERKEVVWQNKYKLSESNDTIIKYNSEKNSLMAGYHISYATEHSLSLAFEILSEVLIGCEGAILKKPLLKLGSKLGGGFDDSRYLSMFSIYLEGSSEIDIEKFREVINSTLKKTVEEGIDRKLIEGAIHRLKFYLKEEDFGYKPRGLFYNLRLLNGVLYGDNTFEPLKVDKLFEDISKIDYEELIDRYLINKGCYGILIAENQNKKTAVDRCIRNDDVLKKYQSEKDTAEELEKIPMINISNINPKVSSIESIIDKRGVYVPLEKDDIVYVDIVMDTSQVPLNIVNFIGIYSYIADKLNIDIKNDIDRVIGNLSIYNTVYDTKAGYMPALVISAKMLKENIGKGFALINQLMESNTYELNRVWEIIQEQKSRVLNRIIKNGNSAAVKRCLSYIDDANMYRECVGGIDFYKFLCGLEKNEEICHNLKTIHKYINNKSNMYVTISCNKRVIAEVKNEIEELYNNLGKKDEARNYIKCSDNKNERFIINSKVEYNALGGKFENYIGSMAVLKQIITRDYIWNKIRVEGGAYGGGAVFDHRGYYQMNSYRDPNIEETYKRYKELPEYISQLNLSKRELQRYIIGAINEADRPLKDNELGEIVLRRNLAGKSDETRQKYRDELLNVSSEEIIQLGGVMENIISQGYKCSIGGKENGTGNLFEEITRII